MCLPICWLTCEHRQRGALIRLSRPLVGPGKACFLEIHGSPKNFGPKVGNASQSTAINTSKKIFKPCVVTQRSSLRGESIALQHQKWLWNRLVHHCMGTRPKTSMFCFGRLLIKCSFLFLVGWRPHSSDGIVRHRGPTLCGWWWYCDGVWYSWRNQENLVNGTGQC